ncbi:hypothetical protein ACIA8G_35285 [Lentzea sp. NPDC051213]|uniref:hypothetical protein n=1 Tax=Lentzea sp. NPDC051213 TaxID=3364126 RepID=UPI0037B4E05A
MHREQQPAQLVVDDLVQLGREPVVPGGHRDVHDPLKVPGAMRPEKVGLHSGFS